MAEDVELLSKVLEKSKKWCEIAREIGGRTENGVKNRFNSLMKKWAKAKKYKETVPESTKIKELHAYFAEKTKNHPENLQKNQNLLLNIKRLNPFSLKKRHHLREIVEKNTNNLLFELMESEIQRKNLRNQQKFLTKYEPPLQKLVKKEPDLAIKTENFAQFSRNSACSPVFFNGFLQQRPQTAQNSLYSLNFNRNFPVFQTFFLSKPANNCNNFNYFN